MFDVLSDPDFVFVLALTTFLTVISVIPPLFFGYRSVLRWTLPLTFIFCLSGCFLLLYGIAAPKNSAADIRYAILSFLAWPFFIAAAISASSCGLYWLLRK
jgi:hypothetical protein